MRKRQLHQQDVVPTIPLYPDRLLTLTMVEPTGLDSVTPTTPCVCRICQRGFCSFYTLKKHAARAHAPANERVGLDINFSRHGTCRKQLYRRANLQYHNEQGACQHFDPNRALTRAPHIGRPEVKQLFQQGGIEAMCADRSTPAQCVAGTWSTLSA